MRLPFEFLAWSEIVDVDVPLATTAAELEVSVLQSGGIAMSGPAIVVSPSSPVVTSTVAGSTCPNPVAIEVANDPLPSVWAKKNCAAGGGPRKSLSMSHTTTVEFGAKPLPETKNE
jgi:hypothetical protein